METIKGLFNKVSESAVWMPKEAIQKKEKIKKTLSQLPIDIIELRNFCISQYGLVDNEMRKIAWPLLLNIHEEEKVKNVDFDDTTTTPKFIVSDRDDDWAKITILEDKKMADQIDKDVKRSLNQYNLNFSANYYKGKLAKIMIPLFQNNRKWTYSQGFNDVCSVFLMVLGGDTKPSQTNNSSKKKQIQSNMGYYASCSITHYFMRDYLRESFEQGVIPALNLLMKIIQGTDAEVYEKIKFMEIPTFAVSWIITWFAHDLEIVNDIHRLYDYCLANHPATIIYIAAATVIYNRDMLMDMEDDDISVIHMIFQNLGTEIFNLEDILTLTNKLLKDYPIDSLLYDNRNIGFLEDSPIFNENLQVDAKLQKVAESTNQQYIKYEVSQWDKFSKKYLIPSNIVGAVIVGVSAAIVIKHVFKS